LLDLAPDEACTHIATDMDHTAPSFHNCGSGITSGASPQV
jgi:hypothetical protein